MHRTTLGDFELTVVSDGTYFLDAGAFFGVVPKTMWSKKVTPDEQNRPKKAVLPADASETVLALGIGRGVPISTIGWHRAARFDPQPKAPLIFLGCCLQSNTRQTSTTSSFIR